MKLELRAMTKSHLIRERPVMMSSTIPSAKYSCSGSPLIFVNGITANDGLSGGARAGCSFARSTFVLLLLDGDRPDIAVAAARQCLNPAVTAGLLRKDPPQCRNLNG